MKICQDWSYFIELRLFEHFSEFLFPCLVLVFLATTFGTGESLVLDRSFAEVVVVESNGFRLGLLEQRLVGKMELGLVVVESRRMDVGLLFADGKIGWELELGTILHSSILREYFPPSSLVFSLLKTFPLPSGIKNDLLESC